MAFWNQSSLEPKRQHRWLLYVGGEPVTEGGAATSSIGIPTYVVKKVTKPQFNVSETIHSFYGHKFYYPGVVEWQQTSFTLVDPVDPDVSQILYEALQSSGYQVPDSPLGVNTISKDLSVKALGEIITLRQFNAENDIVDEFALWNPWIISVEFGSLDYESDAMVEVNVTIRYDYATFSTGDA
tara:strand:+ start:1864 stop:2412 length:549 start_codon:yes stop_codon:yes gene_type:complete